jgi:hypothetical protein
LKGRIIPAHSTGCYTLCQAFFKTMTVQISDRALRLFFFAVIATNVFLITMTALADLQVPFALTRIGQQADLKEEGVFAAWYSSLLLSLNALAAFLIANSGSTPATQTRVYRLAWTGAACVFLALSIDETAQFHEKTATAFYLFVGHIPYLTDLHPTFGWVLLFLPFVVGFVVGAIMVIRTWLAFNPRSRLFALAAVACWVGVVLTEAFESQQWFLGRSRALEEGLEIIGSTLFLVSFTEYLKATCKVAYLGAKQSQSEEKPSRATAAFP